jgi:hypothetical protein
MCSSNEPMACAGATWGRREGPDNPRERFASMLESPAVTSPHRAAKVAIALEAEGKDGAAQTGH